MRTLRLHSRQGAGTARAKSWGLRSVSCTDWCDRSVAGRGPPAGQDIRLPSAIVVAVGPHSRADGVRDACRCLGEDYF